MAKRPKRDGEGRPTKYDPTYSKAGFRLCLLGATDAQIAEFFEVTESTINLWKKTHPEFSESLKSGKLQADTTVAASLFKRAKGFRFKERTFEQTMITSVTESGDLVQRPGTLVKIVEKTVSPDVTAQIFWLKNRQPAQWRDKQEHEIKGKIDIEQITGMEIIKPTGK